MAKINGKIQSQNSMTISNYTSLQEHFKFENSISQYIDDIKISNKTKLDKNFFFSK